MQTVSLESLNTTLETSLWPEFKDVEVQEPGLESDIQSVRLLVSVGDQLSYFAGHFPDQAVLPGVVQIHWAAKLGLQFFLNNDDGNDSINLKKIKFINPILPGNELTLDLSFRPQKSQLNFNYYNQHHQFSSGIIVLTEQDT